jgi:hypothetical protein
MALGPAGRVDPLALAVALAVGLLAGVASGLFGVGGGIVMVPAAMFLLGQSFHVAKAASLLVITTVTAIGIWEHRRERHVDLALGLMLGAGGASGSYLATLLAEQLRDAQLQAGFGVLLVATGARLWFEMRERDVGHAPRWVAAPLVGFGAGALAGLFGVGGGVLMVPAMVFLGVPVHTAVGTSLVAVLTNAAMGTAVGLFLGYGAALLALGAPLALGAAAGIRLGARAASRMPAVRLRRGFGAFLVAVGLFMALTSGR